MARPVAEDLDGDEQAFEGRMRGRGGERECLMFTVATVEALYLPTWEPSLWIPCGASIWDSHIGIPYGDPMWGSHVGIPYGDPARESQGSWVLGMVSA